jgi:enterochelin esterase-like enzyme
MPVAALLRSLAVAALLAAPLAPLAQTPAPAFRSFDVHPDGTITLRYRAPNAQKVDLIIDTILKPVPMTRGDDGIWTVTTPVLAPEYYNYAFTVDGVHVPDPKNPEVHPGFGNVESLVTVPGTPAMPWELTDVPHGEVSLHRFTTHVAKNLPANQDAYIVYTPAGYDAKKKGGYPVLYLLHGYGDNEEAWTRIAHAHFILDNMIAAGKCEPMIVVMPLGYGNLTFLTGGFSNWSSPATVDQNSDLFEQSLETEIMPAVEHEYDLAKSRNQHAISGLSMGGLETLTVGLHHTDQFAYIASMSAAVSQLGLDSHFPGIDAKKADLKLLWVGVGVSDHLLGGNRDFVAWARAKGFQVTAVETPGAHQWPVWSHNLVTVLPLLFR